MNNEFYNKIDDIVRSNIHSEGTKVSMIKHIIESKVPKMASIKDLIKCIVEQGEDNPEMMKSLMGMSIIKSAKEIYSDLGLKRD